MTRKELEEVRRKWLDGHVKYSMCLWSDFKYEILSNILYIRRSGRGTNDTWADCIIMADTETSKKCAKKEGHNHVCAFTISIRAFDRNLVTLYGHNPEEFVECLSKIRDNITADHIIVFFHNMPYDYTFLRRFLYAKFGTPEKQLNIKSHYPLFMNFSNGIQIRDSLILAQRSLEKWAKDMQVEHQKAVGFWNYDRIRNQNETFTPEELEYIEHDTLAGVECIEATLKALKKKILSIPYTATGIPREEVRKRGKKNGAKDLFDRISLSYKQYTKLLDVFHGGFTHANRHLIGRVIKGLIQCYDFASSYPFVLLSEKYPMEKFTELPDCKLKDILRSGEDTAFMFKLILYKVHLKDDFQPMPALQLSKAKKTVNVEADNGRILSADYVEIYTNEVDASVIASQYVWEGDICVEVEGAHKDYLPRWFTDYIYELFTDKCKLKKGDPVLYALAKAKLNSLYGLCVQKSIKQTIEELYIDTVIDGIEYKAGDFVPLKNQNEEELYQKYLDNKGNILLFSWGCWCTSYAFRNLFKLGACVDDQGERISHWIYSDTDSCYSDRWDVKKIEKYNEECKKKLIANGYGPVVIDGREFWLGIAEHKELEDDYCEFVTVGAKRYCGRCLEDNKLHITVAGVPKKEGALCLSDNIENFGEGFIFNGNQTGKLTHKYFYVDQVYTDENGNITGDSIDLSPCDYLLSATSYNEDWFSEFEEEVTIQVFDEGRIF